MGRPEGRVIPGIFADVDAQALVFEVDRQVMHRRFKITGLIEYIITGQQALVAFGQNRSPVNQHCRIVQGFAGLRGEGWGSYQYAQAVISF